VLLSLGGAWPASSFCWRCADTLNWGRLWLALRTTNGLPSLGRGGFTLAVWRSRLRKLGFLILGYRLSSVGNRCRPLLRSDGRDPLRGLKRVSLPSRCVASPLLRVATDWHGVAP